MSQDNCSRDKVCEVPAVAVYEAAAVPHKTPLRAPQLYTAGISETHRYYIHQC